MTPRATVLWSLVVAPVAVLRYARSVAARVLVTAAERMMRLSWWIDPAPPCVPAGGEDVIEEANAILERLEGRTYE